MIRDDHPGPDLPAAVVGVAAARLVGGVTDDLGDGRRHAVQHSVQAHLPPAVRSHRCLRKGHELQKTEDSWKEES